MTVTDYSEGSIKFCYVYSDELPDYSYNHPDNEGGFSNHIGDFNFEVNELLKKGWILHGNTFINDKGRYCQALTTTKNSELIIQECHFWLINDFMLEGGEEFSKWISHNLQMGYNLYGSPFMDNNNMYCQALVTGSNQFGTPATNYQLLEEAKPDYALRDISGELQDGWILYGNPFVAILDKDEDTETVYYVQALIKNQINISDLK